MSVELVLESGNGGLGVDAELEKARGFEIGVGNIEKKGGGGTILRAGVGEDVSANFGGCCWSGVGRVCRHC